MKVLYHKNCYDGFGAAWAIWHSPHNVEDFISVEYGAPPPPLEDEVIYIVDFSYPRKILDDMRSKNRKVFVIDHHKTAKDELAGLQQCVFDMSKSGAVLTWEHFSRSPVPKLLLYIQDRDLWKFELPNSKAINAYLRSQPFNFERFDELQHVPDFMVTSGESILAHVEKAVGEMCERSVWRVIHGHYVPVVNATAYYSEVGDELCRRNPDIPFSASYFDRADGKRQWSLRSRSDFDVSAIAKAFGGGGHQQAAGFETEMHGLGL